MPGIFVVGCSRSGTSALQKHLITELLIWSLPETEFFLKKHVDLFSKLDRLKSLLDKAGVNWRKKQFNNDDAEVLNFAIDYFDRKAILSYILKEESEYKFLPLALDTISESMGYQWWVEKTPTHYQFMDRVLRSRESDLVIYLIRDGVDVAASIRDRALKNSPIFDNQLSLDYSVNLWNDSLKKCLALKRIYGERLAVISYEDFVNNKSSFISLIKDRSGLNYRSKKQEHDIRIVGKNEYWKSGLNDKLTLAKSKKDLFTKEELLYLKENLRYDLYLDLKASKYFAS